MEKFAMLTPDAMLLKETELKTSGFQETKVVELVEVGKYAGIPSNGIQSFTIVTFERIDEKTKQPVKLYFKACSFNIRNLVTLKTYTDVLVKVTDAIKTAYAQPQNAGKEALIEAVKGYKDKTYLTVLSISN